MFLELRVFVKGYNVGNFSTVTTSLMPNLPPDTTTYFIFICVGFFRNQFIITMLGVAKLAKGKGRSEKGKKEGKKE